MLQHPRKGHFPDSILFFDEYEPVTYLVKLVILDNERYDILMPHNLQSNTTLRA